MSRARGAVSPATRRYVTEHVARAAAGTSIGMVGSVRRRARRDEPVARRPACRPRPPYGGWARRSERSVHTASSARRRNSRTNARPPRWRPAPPESGTRPYSAPPVAAPLRSARRAGWRGWRRGWRCPRRRRARARAPRPDHHLGEDERPVPAPAADGEQRRTALAAAITRVGHDLGERPHDRVEHAVAHHAARRARGGKPRVAMMPRAAPDAHRAACSPSQFGMSMLVMQRIAQYGRSAPWRSGS